MTRDKVNAIRLVVAHELGYTNEYVKYASMYLQTGKLNARYLVHVNIESVFAVKWVKKNILTEQAKQLSQKYIQA